MPSIFHSTDAIVLFALVACAHLTFAVPLSYIDIREHRLPNKLTLALSGAVVCTAAILALVVPSLATRVLGACTIALIVGILAVGFALLSPASLGMGDAKVTPATVLLAALGGAPVLLGAVYKRQAVRRRCARSVVGVVQDPQHENPLCLRAHHLERALWRPRPCSPRPLLRVRKLLWPRPSEQEQLSMNEGKGAPCGTPFLGDWRGGELRNIRRACGGS